MKAGILGGTFDPVHNAHLAMARAALDHVKLAKIVFMPTGSPRYRTPAVASGEHRVAMLRLALEYESRYEIDARELAPGARRRYGAVAPDGRGPVRQARHLAPARRR